MWKFFLERFFKNKPKQKVGNILKDQIAIKTNKFGSDKKLKFFKKIYFESVLTNHPKNGLVKNENKQLLTSSADEVVNKHRGEEKIIEPWLLALIIQLKKLKINTKNDINK